MTARIAWASNPGGTTAIWVCDRLDGLWNDEDLADRYRRDGRPSLSPAQWAAVCVLRFLLGLSDRLGELADEDGGRRYGRPVRLGKNPTRPKTRILATGHDAVRFLEHLYRQGTDRMSMFRPTARTATPAATRRHVRDRVRAVASLLTAEEGTRHNRQ
ncbi:hypothetical protein ACWGJ2_20280 [Streptomyces sp. NPDC054796]